MNSSLKTNYYSYSHSHNPILFFGIIRSGSEIHDSINIDNNYYIDIQIAK